MIAKLSGNLDICDIDNCVIDVGGVGYLVFCSARTLATLGGKGATVSLLVETHVREDHIHLFGFAEATERDWFKQLLFGGNYLVVFAKVILDRIFNLGHNVLSLTCHVNNKLLVNLNVIVKTCNVAA